MRGLFDVEVFDPDLEYDDFELFNEYEEEYLDDDLEFDDTLEVISENEKDQALEVNASIEFRPTPVENPGGGRIKDKTPPNQADLVTVKGVGGKRIQLHRLAEQAWRMMVKTARADGIRHPLLLPISGYRSPERQKRLWKRALKKYGSEREARKWVARPGSSAHQTGRAIDFYLGGRNNSHNVANLRKLPAYSWLAKNARRFGFYPYQREPWHWEYNPPASITRPQPTPSVFTSVPKAVLSALRQGLESQAIRLAVHRGIRNENKLTDLVFFARHPERIGQPLKSHERQLAKEWLDIRNRLVMPTLAQIRPAGHIPTISSISDQVIIIPIKNPRLKSLESGVKTRPTARFRAKGDPRDIIIGSTVATEGGYDTVNMYDRGILSWGIMQWTVHQGSLQEMLTFVKQRLIEIGKTSIWKEVFPDLDVKRIGGKYQLIYQGTPIIGQRQLRQLLRGDPRRGYFNQKIIHRWAKIFAIAGRHPIIQQLQREYARKKVDNVLRRNLGKLLSSFKRRFCQKRSNKSLWRWVCRQLPKPSQFYRSNYGPISNYVKNDLKAATLFFGMWTNNPASSYVHLKKAIDKLASRHKSYDITLWPPRWQVDLTAEFEQILRASRFGYWGDAKSKAVGRKSRTQKILDAFYRLKSATS